MEVAVFALVPVLAVLAALTWIVWQVLKGLRFLVVGLFRGIGSGGGRIFRFIRTEIVETVQLVGAILTAAVLLPLTVVNFLIVRELDWRVQCEVSRRYRSRVEVLMKPPARRYEDAGLVPGDNNLLLTLFPHDGKPFARRDRDGEAGAVAVPLLVLLRRNHRHVSEVGRVRELHGHACGTCSP